MIRSQVAADILAAIQACLGARCGDYVFLRSRGVPPADCNSISASWITRTTKPFEDCGGPEPCASWAATNTLRIAITSICMGPDGQPTFDFALEDTVAACFDDDVDLIESCLSCTDWTQFYADHGIESMLYVDTTYDVMSEGGGFTAYIQLRITAGECCP